MSTEKQTGLFSSIRNNKIKITTFSMAGVAVMSLAYFTRGITIGSNGPKTDKNQAEALAMKQYDNSFRSSSPIKKYEMQYIDDNQTQFLEYPKGTGFFNKNNASGKGPNYWFISIGNSCLKGTAFSTVSSSSSVHAYGEVSTANSNDLFVHTSGLKNTELEFSGVQTGDQLTPANSTTEDILDSYGCKTGINSIELEEYLGQNQWLGN